MEKISAVYKIVNTVTGDSYVGSSKNVQSRWAVHKCPSTWKKCPSSPLYQDFQKYGLENFRFQILAPVIPEHLKQVEQEFIEMLNPTYNSNRAKGWDVKRTYRYWYWSGKGKEWHQSDKGKKADRKARNKYNNQLCFYNGETLTLNTLSARFQRARIEHPTLEAKKYLIK